MLDQARRADAERRVQVGRSGALVFALALLIRLLALAELRDTPLFRTPQLDSREYLEWALHLAAFEAVWPADLPHGPGYPIFVALVLRLSGGSLTAVRVVQAILGATSCLLIFRIVKQTWGERPAAVAGTLLALFGPLILVDVSILAEGLLLALVVAAVSLANFGRPVISHVAYSGLLLGFAVIVRPTAAVAFPVLLAGVIGRAEGRRVLAAAVFCAGLALVVAPVVAINAERAGGFLPVQAKSGFNLYQGLSPRLTGTASLRPGGPYETAAAEAARRGLHGAEADRYYLRKLLDEIRGAPAGFAQLIASKALWLVQNVELRDSHSFYFFRGESILLSVTLPFAVLVSLAAAGLLVAFREKMPCAPLAWMLLLFAVTVLLTMAGSRYRMPLVPFIGAYAGLGAVRLYDLLHTRRFREALAPAAALSAALALSLARDHPPSHEFSEEWTWTGNALLRERRFDAARDAYLRALEQNPRSSRALTGLARLEMLAGRHREAGRLADQALVAGQADPEAHSLAAEMAAARGDHAAAAREFGLAARILPDWGEVRVLEAESYLRAGRLAEAERAWRAAIELFEEGLVDAPAVERARAWQRLAQILEAQGKSAEARSAAARAARLVR